MCKMVNPKTKYPVQTQVQIVVDLEHFMGGEQTLEEVKREQQSGRPLQIKRSQIFQRVLLLMRYLSVFQK